MTIQVVNGLRAVVSSGHALATEAALAVLRKGGNAVDAAVCGAVVLAVTCPYACSLAGDMYMLIHDPSDGRVLGLNATGRAPAAAGIDRFPDGIARTGILSATVPGLLAGLADVLERMGTLRLAELIEPALALAANGFPVHPYFTKNIEDRKALLLRDSAARDLFLPKGEPLQPGTQFVQRELADALRLIAKDGAQTFYKGELLGRMLASTGKLGGMFSASDFAEHRSLWQEPLAAPFYGHDVWTMPPNSYGATLLLQLIELEAGGIADADPEGLPFIEQGFAVRKLAYAAAAKFIADPDLAERPLRRVLDNAIAEGRLSRPVAAKVPEAADRSTTNIVVVDESGLAVSLIESISTPFGAGIVIDGTGIVLNNRMAGFNTDAESINCVGPGKRPAHTLAPCIVTKDGKLTMSVGTPGTVGQTCTLAQFLARVLAIGQDPADAILAPRWSVDFQGKLIVEESMAEPLRGAVLSQGAQAMPVGWISFGSIKLAMATEAGLSGFADDRRSAATAGY